LRRIIIIIIITRQIYPAVIAELPNGQTTLLQRR